jgi:hypothetical protein
MKHIEQVPIKIRQIYAIVSELETMFGRHFTPDGHMVGSIGEVLAAFHYELELYTASAVTHDVISKSGTEVQINPIYQCWHSFRATAFNCFSPAQRRKQ